ncbi:large ribosomal subunit protein uL23m isoform X2 [Hypanus sabinus]|uniref:large ribosomal subunit protein uL23m isoform X2 n=1 Tax=Hypanus sabinus TaxID=79690 RepID=UPI0028C47C05|nr:large ribosomal subunit protein uL23m isoform X2 [Hypanus sabinus]
MTPGFAVGPRSVCSALPPAGAARVRCGAAVRLFGLAASWCRQGSLWGRGAERCAARSVLPAMARRVIMTKPDVKNYLQGIYNVPVAAVRTRIQFCTSKKRNHKNQRVKRPDYKVAYVQLAGGQTFNFPDIFPRKDQTPEPGSLEEIQNKFLEDEKQKQKADPRRGGVTEWFGL